MIEHELEMEIVFEEDFKKFEATSKIILVCKSAVLERITMERYSVEVLSDAIIYNVRK